MHSLTYSHHICRNPIPAFRDSSGSSSSVGSGSSAARESPSETRARVAAVENMMHAHAQVHLPFFLLYPHHRKPHIWFIMTCCSVLS